MHLASWGIGLGDPTWPAWSSPGSRFPRVYLLTPPILLSPSDINLFVTGTMTYHIGFIIEQTLGHIAHSQNLQRNVKTEKDIQAYWGLPSWDTHGLAGQIPLYKSNWTLRAGWRARREIARMRRAVPLDALFFHTQVTAVLSPDWLARVPSVVSLDATPEQYDALGEYYDHSAGTAWLERFKWTLNRRCFQGAQHLVAWSEWAKQGLIQGYQVPAERITVIPPGVNLPQWAHPGTRDPHGETVKILFVGGNFERKGGRHLLDAFRSLYQEAPFRVGGLDFNIELHIVSRDPIPDQPGVRTYRDIQPNSPALKQLYDDSDIFCLPTYGDCLPMVLSEAGASGLPLISTQVAAIPEIVLEGDNGFLVSSGDTRSLTQALRALILDPGLRRSMGARGTEIVAQKFDAHQNATRLLNLLKEVADRGKAFP